MNTPFGPAFADLTLDHLRAFFAEPRVESLTWEAKGEGLPSEPAREQLRPEQVREPVCAFANALPDIYGHLVLGVDPATPADERKSTKREASNWAVNGWAPRGDDPHEWMSNCVGSIDPRPHIEIKSFAVEGSRWVTVVQIAPSPIVPCITTEGLIFERLPGVTQTVRTSETLRALYARGETARSRAETLSRRTVLELSQTNLLDARPLAVVAIGAPALPADISSPLFRESTVNEVLKLLTRGARFRVGADFRGEALVAWVDSSWGREVAWIGRDGGIAVGDRERGEDQLSALAGSGDTVRRLWSKAHAIARQLGAYGPTHVSVFAADRLKAGGAEATEVVLTRWSAVEEEPTDAEIHSLSREAARRLGRPAWEPEAGP